MEFFEFLFLLDLGFVLLLAPFVAHAIGYWMSRNLRVEPGHIREWMPSIPSNAVRVGSAEQRWDRRRRAAESKLLRRFEGGVQGAEASQLAAQLGEDETIIAAALAHLREEVPCRLQVTRSGKLLHDFEAADIATLKSKRTLALPARMGLFIFSVVANIGAAWPVLISIFVAAWGLHEINVAPDEDHQLLAACLAIGGLLTLLAANWVAGWVMHLVLTPMARGPRLGDTSHTEKEPNLEPDWVLAKLFDDDKTGASMAASDATWIAADVSTSSSGCSGGDLDFDLDDPRGLLVILAVILLLIVIVICSAATLLWLRGLWRAARAIGQAPASASPSEWIRGTPPVDGLERYLPTNDLVLRLTRVLRRMLSHRHVQDGEMVARILSRARAQGGRVAALEITLMEGLDPADATAIGAQLIGLSEGELHVGQEGEIEFIFPQHMLANIQAEYDGDMQAEYLRFDAQGRPARRHAQKEHRLPVNMPGISWGHLIGSDRLAAGTVMMALTGAAAAALVPDLPSVLRLAAESLLPIFALGSFTLSASARYVARAEASLGVRRDIRRAAFVQIRHQLASNPRNPHLDLVQLRRELKEVFSPSYKKLEERTIQKELEAVCIDLELDPDPDLMLNGEPAFSLKNLQQRLETIERERQNSDTAMILQFGDSYDDLVVFDSVLKHDRVRALA